MKQTIDEAIMKAIINVFDNMDDDDRANWTPEEAEAVVSDLIKWDKVRGFEPLPYAPEDFYDTIRELIEQEAEDVSCS